MKEIDFDKDEWIDFVDGHFIDLDPSMAKWDEDQIKNDWIASQSKETNEYYNKEPKGALFNWTDRAIIMAKLLWS